MWWVVGLAFFHTLNAHKRNGVPQVQSRQNEMPLLVHQHLYSSLEFYNLSTHINKNPHKLLLNMCGTVPTGSCINININTEACLQSVMVEAVGLGELFPAPWG